MSIINDALKKAEKEKQTFQNKPHQILSKIDKIKTDTERYVLKRWLIWAGTGIVCLLGVILVTNSFKHPVDSDLVQEVTPKTELPQRTFHLRKIDLETHIDSSDFHLSGILYDEQRPLVIINERIVGEGALINGAKLLEIQPNYVRLSFKGKEFTLKIR